MSSAAGRNTKSPDRFIGEKDNFFTGTKDNVLSLLSNPHFEIMRHDVTFPLYVEVDEIYNLAAQSHVQVSFETPEYTANSDAIGALRLLDVAPLPELAASPAAEQPPLSSVHA